MLPQFRENALHGKKYKSQDKSIRALYLSTGVLLPALDNDTTLVFPHYKLITSQAADYFCILVGYFENTVKHFSLVKTFFIML